jgi:hypothetical protein
MERFLLDDVNIGAEVSLGPLVGVVAGAAEKGLEHHASLQRTAGGHEIISLYYFTRKIRGVNSIFGDEHKRM